MLAEEYGQTIDNMMVLSEVKGLQVAEHLGVSPGYLSNCRTGRETIDRARFLDVVQAIVAVYQKRHQRFEQFAGQVDQAINQHAQPAGRSAAG